ncbi:MAG: purine-nucleoside phosphorylase [Bdellovibrionota bacterium]
MAQPTVYQKIREAVDAIHARSALNPELGVILGSGLGAVADCMTDSTVIPYTDIPSFHGTTIEGHAGSMIIGLFEGVPTVFLQGRFHLYEGYSMEDVAFPTRTICGLGIKTLILTNAAGGVNNRFRPGDLMLIEDHLNLMGDNPLKGPNLSQLGPRFPDLSEAYSKDCLNIMRTCAKDLSLEIHQGIYAGLLGPTFETPAEIRMYRMLGADAVGMSTVPESIVANHFGVRVAGISYISNLAAGLAKHKLTHQEVLENSHIGAEKLSRLLHAAIPKLVHKPQQLGLTS